jgi:transcriptional regulator with XRE-family HTH domain
MVDLSRFAINVRKFREQKGWSQEKLGEELGVKKAAISQWENDVTVPRLAKLIEMTTLFNCSVAELLGANARDTLIEDELRGLPSEVRDLLLASFRQQIAQVKSIRELDKKSQKKD